ncbi:MAG: hypothetical protein R8L53_10350, partial [Mariprofundales bacterium]
AVGKIALKDPKRIDVAVAVHKHYGCMDDYEEWLDMFSTPIAKLAIWLCKNKKESQIEYPKHE